MCAGLLHSPGQRHSRPEASSPQSSSPEGSSPESAVHPLLAPGQCPVTLKFSYHALEQQWLKHWTVGKHTQDRAAAWMYAGMLAPGLITMLCAAAFKPSLWNPQMEGCAIMTITTSTVLFAHLVLPPTAYGYNRAKIVMPIRFLYIASAVYKGLQQCSTVTSWVNGAQTESPFSAFLWRTGIIAMLWHGGAFRLPFRQQLYLQSIAAMAYTMFLAEPVCQSLPAIQHGQHTVLVAHRILQACASVWRCLAFIVTGNEALLYDDISSDSQAGAGVGSAGMQLGLCLFTVRTWQVIVGHVSLSGLLYCLEASDRRRWRQERLSAASSQRSQRQEQQEQQGQPFRQVQAIQRVQQQQQQPEQLTVEQAEMQADAALLSWFGREQLLSGVLASGGNPARDW